MGEEGVIRSEREQVIDIYLLLILPFYSNSYKNYSHFTTFAFCSEDILNPT